MLIIPLTGKISWRNPPIITIVLILINCLVHFIFQYGDSDRRYEAELYYFTSGLAQMEVPKYMAYLEVPQPEGDTDASSEELDERILAEYHFKMENDYQFLQKLRSGKIISPAASEYTEWRDLRQSYEEKLAEVVSYTYSFRPAYHAPITFVTHMFLHGNAEHLIGNMIFLWIVGCALELGCGRLLYAVVYLIGGLFAVTLYWLLHLESTVSLVGASGAISGLMGAFTVLFGKKRIKVFYYLLVYFNYLKVPAIVLLPVWIGKELYYMLFGGVSQVAYAAHLGGLVGGALLGFIVWKYIGFSSENIIKEEPVDEISPLLEHAQKYIAELDLDNGCQKLQQVLSKDPQNVTALTHLFNIEKLDPQKPRFHETAGRLLSLLCRDNHNQENAFNVYKDYTQHTSQPRLSPELYLRISSVCSAVAQFDRSIKILSMLMKKRPDLPGIPTALLKLATRYRQKGLRDNWKKCLTVICSRYPQSGEARIAKRALNT
jgi:membrane associated rhomboid family serine protease